MLLVPLHWMSTENTLKKTRHWKGVCKPLWWGNQVWRVGLDLKGLQERYELHHGVRITEAAIVAAAELSHRYIADRFLPDKAIDLIDEAASRLRLQIDSLPEELDALERQIRQLEIEREALKREQDSVTKKQAGKESAKLNQLEKELADLIEKERECVLNGIKNDRLFSKCGISRKLLKPRVMRPKSRAKGV